MGIAAAETQRCCLKTCPAAPGLPQSRPHQTDDGHTANAARLQADHAGLPVHKTSYDAPRHAYQPKGQADDTCVYTKEYEVVQEGHAIHASN